ncbi:hypothetical protein [Moorena producens]|uniref:hypothetical protein n=1 Tax=Moorena producens TaxID=1155739 RepID=UPI003C783568
MLLGLKLQISWLISYQLKDYILSKPTLAFGHAIAFNLQQTNLQPSTNQPSTLAFGHAIAFNLQPINLQPSTIQPSTFNNPTFNNSTIQPSTFNLQQFNNST